MSDTLPPDIQRVKSFLDRMQQVIDRAILRQDVIYSILGHHFDSKEADSPVGFRHHTANFFNPHQTTMHMMLDAFERGDISSVADDLKGFIDKPEAGQKQSDTEQSASRSIAALDNVVRYIGEAKAAEKLSGAEDELIREYSHGLQNDIKAMLRLCKEAEQLAERVQGGSLKP